MEASITWVDGLRLIGEAGSGHSIVIDGPPDDGGRNAGVRPMELLLIGLGACSAVDVVTILRKGRHDVSDCQVQLRAERAESPPRVFTQIHLHYVVTGRGLTEAQVARAIDLSAEKYCSASIMLGRTASISHDFELRSIE